MRLSLVMPALAASLLLGWGAVALADAAPAASAAAPPAAPIFYCPAPAPSAVVAPARPGRTALRTARGSHAYCPTPQRVAYRHERAGRRHWRRRAEPVRARMAREEISQSQAFVYGYERALHGLNARAADRAWGPREALPPPPPPHIVMVAPAPPAMIPPPPPPMAAAPPHVDELARDQAVREQAMREQAERDRAEQERVDHEQAVRDLALRQQADHDRAARELAARADAVRAEALRAQDRRNDWRERDRAQAWEARDNQWRDQGRAGSVVIERGDRGYAYDDGRGADGQSGYERRPPQRIPPCPPPHDIGCSAGQGDPPPVQAGGQWRDSGYGPVYRVAGRDAYGYLVWPGKTPGE